GLKAQATSVEVLRASANEKLVTAGKLEEFEHLAGLLPGAQVRLCHKFEFSSRSGHVGPLSRWETSKSKAVCSPSDRLLIVKRVTISLSVKFPLRDVIFRDHFACCVSVGRCRALRSARCCGRR